MKYDIIMIGGGASGSTASLLASMNNYSVLLIERQELERYKPCSGIYPQHNFDGFPELPSSVFERELFTMRCITPRNSGSLDAREFGMTLGKVILRSKYDKYILDESAKKGTVILENTVARKIQVKDDGVRVIVKDANGMEMEYRANILFICTGVGADSLLKQVNLTAPKKIQAVIGEFESSEAHVEEQLSSGAYHFYMNRSLILACHNQKISWAG